MLQTNFFKDEICGDPCLIKTHNKRIKGVTLPGRSQSVGDKRHGNKVQYGSGIELAPSRTSSSNDNI